MFVTDAQGNPVTDLTMDDFEIIEGGRAQTITAFSLVNIPIERVDRPLYSPAAIEPDVFTNHRPEGRLCVIALDEVAPDLALRTGHLLRRFIETQLAANDVAAIVYVGRGNSTYTQDFTSSRRLLLNAVDRFSGGFGARDGEFTLPLAIIAPEVEGAENRSRMRALRDRVEFHGRAARASETMLYVTASNGDVFEVLDYGGGLRSLAFDDFHAVVSAASRSNVAIYPIDPAGLANGSTFSDIQSLRRATSRAGTRLRSTPRCTPTRAVARCTRLISRRSCATTVAAAGTDSARCFRSMSSQACMSSTSRRANVGDRPTAVRDIPIWVR